MTRRELKTISKLNPYGGLIGMGKARFMNPLLSRFKLFRIHAGYHDAYGAMKRLHNMGPGYCYMLPNWKLPNNCFLGHITGLAHWLIIYLFNRRDFDSVDV